MQENQIVAKAYLLNNPYRAVIKQKDGGSLAKTYSAVSVNVPNVVIEVVKKAEDGDETIIRMYECWNRRSRFELQLSEPAEYVYETNLLEEKQEEIPVKENKVSLEIRPFEIKTLVVY